MNNPVRVIKKAICIILLIIFSIILLTAEAEKHLEITCEFSESIGNKTLSIDLFEQKEETVIVSSLFPEFAAIISQQENDLPLNLWKPFLLFLPERNNEEYKITETLFKNWLDENQNLYTNGIFSGELFDDASKMRSCDFTLGSLADFIRSVPGRENEPVNETGLVFYLLKQAGKEVQNISEDYEISIKTKTYDEGHYFTIIFSCKNQTLMTISVDASEEQKRHMVICYRFNGWYYYRDIKYSYDNHLLNITCELYKSDNTYRNTVKMYHPLYRDYFKIQQRDENNINIEALMESNKLNDALYISAEIVRDRNQDNAFHATVSLKNQPEKKITINSYIETYVRKTSFNDKKARHISEENERAEIQLSVYSEAAKLIADIFPMLPSDYQNLIINLLETKED